MATFMCTLILLRMSVISIGLEQLKNNSKEQHWQTLGKKFTLLKSNRTHMNSHVIVHFCSDWIWI